MHRYQPRFHIVYLPPKSNNSAYDVGQECLQNHYRRFIFPETSFTAVTAYQNQRVSLADIIFNSIKVYLLFAHLVSVCGGGLNERKMWASSRNIRIREKTMWFFPSSTTFWIWFSSVVLAFVYDHLDHIRVSFFEYLFQMSVYYCARGAHSPSLAQEEDKLNENHQKLTSAFFM